jgi:glycosyltransferase involved in cell wall biosynthesis
VSSGRGAGSASAEGGGFFVSDRVADQALAAFADEYGPRRLHPLAVVIAALNEEEAIGDVLERIPDMVCGLRVDTIVIDDGSRDGTGRVAREAGALVCRLSVNQGQGSALRLGYRLAEQRGALVVATLDADGQYDPAELETVVGPLVRDEADFVTGSRRLGEAHTTDRVRRAGVVVFAATITLLTRARITDPANGLRAMRVEVPTTVRLRQPQYQAAELLVGAILRGWRVKEVPTSMYERSAGVSKKGRNLFYGLRFARVVLGTWWRDQPWRNSLPLPQVTPLADRPASGDRPSPEAAPGERASAERA